MEEFQIHSAYDHKALKTMSRVLRKTTRRKRSIALRVFGWTAVSAYVLLKLLLLFWGDFDPDIVALLALVLVLSVLLFEDDITAWAAGLNLLPGTREADTRFGADEYVVTTKAAETHMHYENIRIIGETKDSFVFMLSKRHTQEFPKAGIASGTPDEFRDFIEERTGLPVRYVK